MSQTNESAYCIVCGENYLKSKIEQDSPHLLKCECLRCGYYIIDNMLDLTQPPWSDVSHLVSAWISRENQAGRTPTIGEGGTQKEIMSTDWWANRYKNMGFPESLGEKLDVSLLTYAESLKGDYRQTITYEPYMIAKVAAKNIQEIYGLSDLLVQLGYLVEAGDWKVLRVSAKGWLHVEELRKNEKETNTVFIAMWFNEITNEYRKAVISSIKCCGYKPVILDQEEYNGFIMEQVISQIKQTRFLIADFTCEHEKIENGKVKAGVRGGVYWEAGMAYGLNKPVIHTCKDDEESKIRRHFDIDQYNTIFWRPTELSTDIRNLSEKIDNPTFAEKLANRILFVVGRGSYKES